MNARLPNDPIPTRWYVVKSKPRAEREAAEQLTRQDYRVVLPELIQPRKRWEALFPSYLLCNLRTRPIASPPCDRLWA
jgi:hypothetical protein